MCCGISTTQTLLPTGIFWSSHSSAIFYGSDISNMQYRVWQEVSKCEMFVTECSIYEKKDQHHNRNWYAIEQQCGSWLLSIGNVFSTIQEIHLPVKKLWVCTKAIITAHSPGQHMASRCLWVTALSGSGATDEFEINRERGTINARVSVNQMAQCHAKWPSGCTEFQQPEGIEPMSPDSLLLASLA